MNKTILIVGGSGFIGNAIVKKFNQDYKLISISRNFPKKKIKKVTYIKCDILNYNKLKKILEKFNFDIVINALANKDQVHINNKTHIQGNNNLIKYVINKKKIKNFIQIGSSQEYGSLSAPHSEKFFKIPQDDYGYHKLIITFYLKYLRIQKNFPSVIVRPYSIFGPNQKNKHLIPIAITKIKNNKSFEILNPNIKRNFIYIDDFINIIEMIILKKINNADIINIGYFKSITVLQMINKISKQFKNSKIKIKNNSKNTNHYPNLTKLSNLLQNIKYKDYDSTIKKTIIAQK